MLRNQFYMTHFQVPGSTKRLLAGLVGLLLGATTLWAQRPPTGVGGTGRDGTSTTNSTVFAGQEDFDDLDTFGVFSFLVNNPNRETPFSDSLLGYYFHQYDPARRRDLDLGHLGNLGSAHQPIYFQTFPRRGFDIGLHQYDAYLTRASDLPFRVQRMLSSSFVSFCRRSRRRSFGDRSFAGIASCAVGATGR